MNKIIYAATKNKDARGFTLIETLIAIAIFSIGMLAAATMMLRSTSGNTVAGTITNSAESASGRVERLLSSAYNHPDLTNGAHTPTTNDPATDGLDNNYNGQIDEAGEPAGNLAISWTVTETVPEAGTDIYNYKTVTVTVSWTKGSARTVVIQRAIPNIV